MSIFRACRGRAVRTWILGLTCVVLAACGTAPEAPVAKPRGPYFYPPPPAAPRVQHLLTLASRRDLQEARGGFAEFVAGKDNKVMALVQPYGAALFDNKVFVADTGAPAVAVFDLDKRRMSQLPGAGSGRLKRPVNVTIDGDGTRYVTDTGLDQILVYDREDRFLRAIGDGKQFRPVDVAIVGERLVVVDIQNHRVLTLDKRSGTVLSSFGKQGSGKGELFQPTNVAVGPDGDFFVSETGNFRVQRFKPDGTHVRFYGEPGDVPGTFARPKGIAVDRAGRLYVGDSAFQNVQIFDEAGRVLMDFGGPLEGTDGLNLPAAVRLDYTHVPLFEKYADPKFKVEYLVLVVSQFGPNKVDVFGVGRLVGVDYESPAASGKK